MNHKLVYICSPLRGNVESNQEKCRRYCKFACDLGVVPFAPHIFYKVVCGNNSKSSA